MTATHLIVQGVFYRDWTIETARGHGLAGWVRNLADGTVPLGLRAHLEGERDAFTRMIAALHDGPPRAAPTRIDARQIPPQSLSNFQRR